MDLFLSDSDNLSESSESSSFEDQDDGELMYGGQACSILSSLEDTIGKIDDFLSFERGFAQGDIVCSITDPSGQMGRVSNIDMFVDLENVHGSKLKHVDSKRLGKIRSLSVGDYVISGPWLGKVENIVDFVTVLFDDGTKCEYNSMGPQKLIPLSPDLLEDSSYPYYPGQRVRVELSSIAKTTRWLCGPRKEKRDEGTVCAVDAGMAYIDWLGCAIANDVKVASPPRLQSSKDLTLLSCSSHANWQLGDWCTLPLADDKGANEQIYNTSTFVLRQSNTGFERISAPKIQDVFVVVKTMTKVDVIWQDGSQSFGLDSHSLFPVSIVDAHDFWPDQFVVEKGSSDDAHGSDTQRWGFVVSVDAKERTVRVKWETSAMNQVTVFDGEVREEIVSAYGLVEHPDYSYCLGDVVFSSSYKDPVVEGFMDEAALLKGDSYLSRIGMITGLKNGNVEVKWGTGLKTKVAPYEIFRVEKYEDSSVSTVVHDENVEELNETEHDNGISIANERKDLLDSEADGKDSLKVSVDYRPLSLPRVAIGLFSNIAANLFGSTSQYYWPRSEMPSEIEVLEPYNLCTTEQPLEGGDFDTLEETKSEREVNETILKREDLILPSGSQSLRHFPKFDMVSDCSDHHFVNGSGKSPTSPPVKRGWLKKVQQEWSILERDLPETIYVRSYEERMDLLRAAIVGSPGTPYHDNLFFFDIFLPPEYPHEPPLVHYHSGGLRVNPNLYESGKVCLSLLNTWTGSGNEVWNPENSTILQVLLSLQALVLNEKPYFNEAGYDKQIGRAEGEKNSVSYNENAFLVSCTSMMYLLRKPPMHFEVLVEEHFSERSKYIIQACNAYMEGIPVGCAFSQLKDKQEYQTKSSTGFKIMLSKLLPRLVEAFSGTGINCSKCNEAAK